MIEHPLDDPSETEAGPTDVVDASQAVATATELLDEIGNPGIPVPVERIARNLGVQVRYAPLDGDISGMAYIKDGVRIIGVNNLHHANRQRFTLAHELGHLVLHPNELAQRLHLDRGSLHRDGRSSRGEDPLEISANAFASELLMPRRLMSAAMGAGVDLEDDEAVAKLARRFRVSVAAMYYRLHRD